jgi:hypothetical protein
MKTTRVTILPWQDYQIVEAIRADLGPPGMQQERRWFYRVLENGQEWRRKGRRSSLKLVLYFRNSADATYFLLKN